MKLVHLTKIATLVFSAGITLNAFAANDMSQIYEFPSSNDHINNYNMAKDLKLVKDGYYKPNRGSAGYSTGLVSTSVSNGGTQLGDQASSNSSQSGGSGSGQNGGGSSQSSSNGHQSSGIGSMTAANVTNNYINVIGSSQVQIDNTIKQGANGSSQSNSILNTQGSQATN